MDSKHSSIRTPASHVSKYSATQSSASSNYLSLMSESVNVRSGTRPQSCSKWISTFTEYYYKDCSEIFDDATRHYAQDRLRDKGRSSRKDLTSAKPNEREEFFAALTLLVERKTSELERTSILVFLCELVAIEEVTNHSVPFGMQALRTFVGLVLSFTNIKAVLLRVFRRKMAEVVCQMSHQYLIKIIPLLHDIIGHPKYGEQCVQIFAEYNPKKTRGPKKDFAMNLVEAYHRVRSTTQTQGDAHAKRRQEVYSFMARCAENSKIAASFWNMLEEKRSSNKPGGGILAKILTENVHDLKNEMTTRATEIELRANIARNVYDPSKKDKYPAAVDFRFYMNNMVKALDKHASDEKATKPHQIIYQAALTSCIAAVMMRTEKSQVAKSASGRVPKPRNPFITMFIRLAKRTSNGKLVAACLDFLFNVIVKTEGLEKHREVLETQVSLPATIQQIVKNLMTEMRKKRNNTTPAEQKALVLALDIMRFYNEMSSSESSDDKFINYATNLTVKFNVAEIKGYDREEIVFRILEAPMDGTFSGPVRHAAARCLGSVPLHQFSPAEIRTVVTILSRMSSTISENSYAVLTHIVYLMVRLGDREDDDEHKEKVGTTFRTIYAAEVVSTIFELLSHCSSSEVSPIDVQFIDEDQRNCIMACVKFLQLAWKRTELRDGMETEANRSTFVRAMQVEQSMLRYLDKKQFKNHKHVLLEQTWLGCNVESLMQVLESLKDLDIVAFRIYNQMANVLESRNLHSGKVPASSGENGESELVSLHAELAEVTGKGFDVWNTSRCGTELQDTKTLESQPLVSGRHSKKVSAVVPEDTNEMHNAMGTLMTTYLKQIYRVKAEKLMSNQQGGSEMMETARKWVKQARDPKNKELLLVLKNPEDDKRLTALIHGGKIDFKRLKSIVGDRAAQVFKNESDVCEVYHLYIDPTAATSQIAQKMLAEFSHRMREAGFGTCLAWAHSEERGYYATDNAEDVKRGEKMRSAAFRPLQIKKNLLQRRKKDSVKRNTTSTISLDNGGGSIEAEFMRLWSLENNVWQRNEAHSKFLEEKGIEKMINFLSRPEIDENKDGVPDDVKFRVRTMLESNEFGSELMRILKNRGDTAFGDNEEDEDEVPFANSRCLEKPFSDLMTSALINDPTIERTDRAPLPPQWSLFLSGTKEENLLSVKTITPFPAPPPLPKHVPRVVNPHSGPSHYFHTQPREFYEHEKPWENEKVSLDRLGADGKKWNPPSKKPLYDQQIQAAHPEWESKALHRRKQQNEEARLTEDMKPQFRSMTAALIRALYALMSRSSRSVREKTSRVLRRPALFRELIRVLEGFDYEIDASVRTRLAFKFACAQKGLLLTRTLLDISPQGHKQCLRALDFYEVVTQGVRDVLMRLARLVDSRDLDNVRPLGSTLAMKKGSKEIPRRLTMEDEQLMATTCLTLEDVIAEVLQLRFFSGKDPKIHAGNLKCRKQAMETLFLSDSGIVDALMTLIRYDSEISMQGETYPDSNQAGALRRSRSILDDDIDLNPGEGQGTWNSKCDALDLSRLRIVSCLSSLLGSSDAYSYRFFREFASGTIKASTGIRQTFLQDLIRASGKDELLSELQGNLIKNGTLDDDENLEYVTFVEIAGNTKLIAMGNGKRYFMSLRTLDPSFTRDISPNFVKSMERRGLWPDFLLLIPIPYSAVRGIYNGYGDQMFAICTSSDRSGGGLSTWKCEVFKAYVYGEAARIVDVFTRYCRDDLDEPLLDRAPTSWVSESATDMDAKLTKSGTLIGEGLENQKAGFFKRAVKDLYGKLGFDVPEDRLYTYCYYAGSIHLLIWLNEDERTTILICKTYENYWAPHVQQRSSGGFINLVERIDLQERSDVEFEFPSTPMATMRILNAPKRKPRHAKVWTFVFACDTGREMWRKEATKYMTEQNSEDTDGDAQTDRVEFYKLFAAEKGLLAPLTSNKNFV